MRHGSTLVADAHALPFADRSLANIVILDVLHHLSSPKGFLREAARVLAPGGRLIMMEPDITPVSRFFLSRFHPEPVDLSQDPLSDDPQSGPAPEDANQAIPYLLMRKHHHRLTETIPELRRVSLTRHSLWAYALSGGFRPWCLIPRFLVRPMLWLENLMMPVLGPLGAFRMLIVMERVH